MAEEVKEAAKAVEKESSEEAKQPAVKENESAKEGDEQTKSGNQKSEGTEPPRKDEKPSDDKGSEPEPVTLSTLDVKIVALSDELRRVQREIWYTRIALAMFLVINLVFIKFCISDVNDTMGMFLQFMMSTLQNGGGE